MKCEVAPDTMLRCRLRNRRPKTWERVSVGGSTAMSVRETREKLVEVVCDAVRELNEGWGLESLRAPVADTALYGADGEMDSMALVALVVDVEERVGDRFGRNIVLADERAMSQKNSPFRTIKSLARYIQRLLDE